MILDEAVTQTDRQRAVSAGRVKSIRGGKDDADLVTGGLDCYRVTSFFIGTCGPGRKPIFYFFWTMKIYLRKNINIVVHSNFTFTGLIGMVEPPALLTASAALNAFHVPVVAVTPGFYAR